MSADLSTSSAFAADPAKNIRAFPFDLVARAELAIHACTSLVNPLRGGQPYSFAELHTDPPIALHSPWDYADVAGKVLDALTLARMMTGQPQGQTEINFAKMLGSCQRDDGLIGLPADPWTHTSPIVEMEWSQRGALLGWATRTLAVDEPDAPHRAEKLVRGLVSRAVWEGDTCWYPASYLPDRGWLNRMPPKGNVASLLIGGQLIFPLVRFYTATGNRDSLRLANGLIRFLRERSGSFEEDGRLKHECVGYLHSTTGFILGVLKYGLTADRPDYVDWALSAYRSARELGTEFGFFPQGLRGQELHQGDVCALKDMIEIALLLGMNGETACLADAERFGRNHLLESQVLDFDWVRNPVDVPFCQDVWCERLPHEAYTTDDICGRALGSFAAWPTLNDAFDPGNPRLMQRCTAAGTRALYDLWHYSVTRPEGAVMVNMHFSRDTRWATVTSFLPHEGRVEVMMKTRGVLAVRLPAGVTNPDVTVNYARARQETVRNGFAWLEALQPGDLVSLKWRLDDRTTIYAQGSEVFTGHWRGDTLMRMTPPGYLNPLYWRIPDMPPASPRGAGHNVREIDSI